MNDTRLVILDRMYEPVQTPGPKSGRKFQLKKAMAGLD